MQAATDSYPLPRYSRGRARVGAISVAMFDLANVQYPHPTLPRSTGGGGKTTARNFCHASLTSHTPAKPVLRYNGLPMQFLQTIAGKVVAGLVGLGIVIAAISWWQMDPAARHGDVVFVERIVLWLGVVALLPWATFAIIAWVGRKDSNAAGAALVAVYTIAELVWLGWLFGWHVGGAMSITLLVVGGLFCAVYNVFACDWIAEKIA